MSARRSRGAGVLAHRPLCHPVRSWMACERATPSHRAGEAVGNVQRSLFICLQRYFLREHDVPFSQGACRDKAPSRTKLAVSIKLVDIRCCSSPDAISLPAVTAEDVKEAIASNWIFW